MSKLSQDVEKLKDEIYMMKKNIERANDIKHIVYALLRYLELDYRPGGSVFKAEKEK